MKNLILALFLFIVSSNIFSQPKLSVDPVSSVGKFDVIGEVMKLSGSTTKIDGETSKETRLGEGHGIKVKDIVKTTSGSFVKFKMIDDTIISIGPNSIFHFKNFIFKTKNDRNGTFDLLAGRIRINVRRKSSKDSLKLNTRTIAMGVRGTEFLVNTKITPKGRSISEVALLKGSLSVKNKINKKEFMIKPKTHHVTIVDKKNNIVDEGSIKISRALFAKLMTLDESLGNIKPFLNFFTGDKIGTGRNPSSLNEEYDSKYMNNDDKQNWKKSLKSLNKRLKEYSK